MRRAPAAPPSARNSEVRTVEKFSWKSPPIGSACPARKCARQVGCSFVMNCFDCTGSCPVCKGAVRGKICPMTALGKFLCRKLAFAREYGNIIRQYRVILRFIMYALVAQPVEHLTFNQRARDSSSLERTKIPRRIVRFLVGFSFSGALHTFAHFCTPAGKPCFSLHCLHSVHREQSLSGLATTSSVEFVTESVKVYKVRQDGFANFIVIKR